MKKINYLRNEISQTNTNTNTATQITEETRKLLNFSDLLDIEKMSEKKQASFICDLIDTLKLDDLKNALEINNKLFFDIADTLKKLYNNTYNNYVSHDKILKYSNYIINQLNASSLTGKLKNINSISTLFLANYRCLARTNSNNNSCICTHCFAQRINLSACLSYFKNTLILCFFKLDFKNLYIASKNADNMIRFESFGDLINNNQFLNYYNIAKNNKKYNFALWTKNIHIIKYLNVKNLNNLSIIESDPIITSKDNIDNKNLNYDFSNYDKKFVVCKDNESMDLLKEKCTNNNLKFHICEARACATCRHCYTDKKNTIVIEKLK